jgi:hypothetical protein
MTGRESLRERTHEMVIGHATAKLPGRETVQGAIDLIEQYCARGWTDGLPIVPPTAELVDRLLGAAVGVFRENGP